MTFYLAGTMSLKSFCFPQSLSSASVRVRVRVGVLVSTMFKFSKMCIIFLLFKVLLSYLAYTYLRVRPFNSIHSFPQVRPFKYEGRAKRSVTNRLPLFYPRYILKFFTALEWCVE